MQNFLSDVLTQLREHGKVFLPSFDQCREVLEGNMTCHKCSFIASRMSALKRHFLSNHA